MIPRKILSINLWQRCFSFQSVVSMISRKRLIKVRSDRILHGAAPGCRIAFKENILDGIVERIFIRISFEYPCRQNSLRSLACLRTVLPDYRNMVPQLTISISYETLQADSVTSLFIFLFQGFGIRKGPLSDRARMRNHRNRSAR